jgi:thioredoxin reductase
VPPTAPDVPTHAKHARASRPEHATIGCFGCHSIHHGFETVAATRTATGLLVSHEVDGRRLSQTELGSDHPLAVRIPIGRTIAWPVVRTQKCTSCHHVDRPGDPARRCFADFSDAAALPVLCDDEHRDEPTPEASAAVALRRAVIVPGGDLAAGRALGVRALEGQGAALDPVGAAALAGVVVLAVLAGSFVSRRRFVGDRAPVVAPPVTAAPNAPAPSIARAQLVPSVNTATCIGCAACVEVCPRGVLAIRDFWAEVVAPEACCGFMLCEAVCPNRSLTIVEGEPPSDRPKMDPNRQSVDRPGIWFAGDIAGAPLIKTAINDGVQAVDAVAASLGAKTQEAGVLDLAVVGAGPAGLAALLRSREKGLVAAAFEKGDAAQTIQLFPRRKLVRVLPLELPVLGKLPLQPGPDGAVPKEALLTVWLRLVREEGLDVRERHEVGAIRAAAGSFEIDVTVRGRGRETTRSETVRARRVIVAVGRRGTPKGLDVPIDPSMEGKIAYHLADAAALAGLTILVSGLGDAAMEAAIGLAEQESTPVHVAYRGAELKTAGRDARNVRRFRDLVDRGRIEVHWRTAVARIEPGAALLRHAETSDERRLPVDQILVFHGGTSPKELLGRFGIHLS